ncbi:MAG: DedA family protein [Sandaracinaceae bacterium]
MLERFIALGSLPLLVLALLLAGLGLPLPEDVALLSGGVVAHLGAAPWWVALPVLYVSAIGGDALLYALARRFGEPLLSHAPFRWLLTAERRERVRGLFARYGSRAVFVGRYLAGLRGVVFALAAIEGVPFRTFLLWDALAGLVTIPLVFGAGYLFSAHVAAMEADLARAEHWIAAGAALTALVVWTIVRWRRRRRLDAPAPPAGD